MPLINPDLGGNWALTPIAEKYLQHVRVEKRLAPRTVELYSLDLLKLTEFAAKAKVDLPQVQTIHIRQWVARMHAGGRSPRGIALILSGWRGFYGWLGREGLVSSNPVVDVRAPKAAKPLPKALSVDDAVQLASFQNGADDPWLEARDAAMVELLYGSGLRVGELMGLDIAASPAARGWLDLDGAEAHVLGKGSKRRIVPVGTQALAALKAWLTVRGQGLSIQAGLGSVRAEPVEAQSASKAALFIGRNGTRLTAQSIWARLRRRSLQAGLPAPVHPHMLRHSFASHVLQSSGDLRAVQELLGHANIGTTQVYTRLDFQHLAKTYDAAHPRAKLPKG
jgi:integrase/recombinase XerC